MRANLIHILLSLLFLGFVSANAQQIKKPKKAVSKSIKKDTIPALKKDSLVLKKTDTISLDSIKPKETVEDIITHTAKDYTLQNAKNKTVTLYNEAHVTYTDIDLKAGIIIVDYKKNTLFAKGIKDSTGYKQRPVFKQGNQESEQDSMIYNFKTKQAFIYGLKTEQSGIITYGDKTKRVNDSTVYIRKIRFTTSQKKIPDYYIATSKAKLVPSKKIIVGPSNLVLADVPTPIVLPFAYFPLTNKATSGFIIPTWGETANQGFFLQNGGYYIPINDYVDLELTGDIYSNGSWGLRTNSQYYKRYSFSGNFSFRFENIIQSLKGFSDFSKATNYNISWTHNQDSKANPNARFTASVNLGSSQYFQQSLNEINNSQQLRNNLNSSINYYKKFVGSPFNLNVSMNHSQTTRPEGSNTDNINMTLPSLQLNMDRIYPFAGKGGVKKSPIQKIGLNYSMQGEYRIRTNDDDFFTSKMFETARAGVQHNASTNTNIKAFKYFTLSPNVTYKEVWAFDHISKTYNPTLVNTDGSTGGVVTDTIRGFKSFREYNTGVSLTTNVYGTFNFKKGRLKAIRHTIRPSISYSYRPDFASKYEQTVQTNAAGTEFETYTPFDQGIYGRPGAGVSNLISLSVNNVLEAKVAPKDPDSDEEDEKITILNNLNFSTSYNIAADSLRWSPVSVSAGTRLFKDKMSLNLGASLDPYKVVNGQRINEFNDGIFRVASANLTANYSISSKDFDKDAKDNRNNNGNGAQNPPDVYGAEINPGRGFANRLPNAQGNSQSDEEEEETKLYQAKVPWTLNLIYSATYANNGISNIGIRTHTLGFSGDLSLSPKWTVGFSSGYDIKDGAFSFTRLNFARDLDSWRFNFSWTPFGTNSAYYFYIGVKASVLSDLKWDKNKPPDRRLF